MSVEQHDQYLAEWESRQEIAEAMVPIIGKIYRSSGVVLKIYGRTLINASPWLFLSCTVMFANSKKQIYPFMIALRY